MLCSPDTDAHTWTGLPAPAPLGMSAVSLCLVAQARMKQRRLTLDSCPDCVLQLGLPERSECCGLSGTCLVINKTNTYSGLLLPSVRGAFSIGRIQQGEGMACWWASLEPGWSNQGLAWWGLQYRGFYQACKNNSNLHLSRCP